MALIFVTMLLIMGVESAIWRRAPLPSGHQLDSTFLISEVQAGASKVSMATCVGSCQMRSDCFYFSITENSCLLYHRASIIAETNPRTLHYYEVPAVLMLRQDLSSGQYFPAFAGSWALNKDDESAKHFSRLDEINNYLGQDGIYQLKICYKALNLGDNCYYFEQKSDPRSLTEPLVEGFKILSHPPGQSASWDGPGEFTGMRGNLDQAWLDGNTGSYYWWFALGSKAPHGGSIPAIYQSETLHHTTHVEFYIIPK